MDSSGSTERMDMSELSQKQENWIMMLALFGLGVIFMFFCDVIKVVAGKIFG
jgi:hypothetical protein